MTICHILSAKVKTHSLRRGEFSEETNSYYIKTKSSISFLELGDWHIKWKCLSWKYATHKMLFLWLETWFWTILSCNAGPDSLYINLKCSLYQTEWFKKPKQVILHFQSISDNFSLHWKKILLWRVFKIFCFESIRKRISIFYR